LFKLKNSSLPPLPLGEGRVRVGYISVFGANNTPFLPFQKHIIRHFARSEPQKQFFESGAGEIASICISRLMIIENEILKNPCIVCVSMTNIERSIAKPFKKTVE
jgi:hypothetical protein